MLTLNDLDFDAHDPQSMMDKERVDALNDIRETRDMLGKFTLRDTVEAIYGSDYALAILGEDGGNDILVEELNVSEDIREANGANRRDIGDNRLPPVKPQDMSDDQRQQITSALREQEAVAENATIESGNEWFKEDAKRFNSQRVVEDIANLSSEDREEIIRLLQEQATSKTKR